MYNKLVASLLSLDVQSMIGGFSTARTRALATAVAAVIETLVYFPLLPNSYC